MASLAPIAVVRYAGATFGCTSLCPSCPTTAGPVPRALVRTLPRTDAPPAVSLFHSLWDYKWYREQYRLAHAVSVRFSAATLVRRRRQPGRVLHPLRPCYHLCSPARPQFLYSAAHTCMVALRCSTISRIFLTSVMCCVYRYCCRVSRLDCMITRTTDILYTFVNWYFIF